MPDVSVTFTGLKAANAKEVKDAIAHVYGVPATVAGVKYAIAEHFVRPAIDSYRQRADSVDLAKPAADFGSDLGDAS
jgi:hypothetical protein